jgi:hypothetical protein
MSLSFASTEIRADEFRKRREQARRNGSPAWLWPEVPVESWAATMGKIGKAARAVLAGERSPLEATDPMALSLACYTSGIGPLLGYWAEEGLLDAPGETGAMLALHLDQGRKRAERSKSRACEIVAALENSGVPVVVLKGGHTAYCYFPEPAVRPASDLDLLVPMDSAAQAEGALARAGLECAGRSQRESSWVPRGKTREPRSIWLVHADDPWSVDLHSSLDFSASAGAPPARLDSADPIGTCESWPLDETAGALSEPLLLLHLAAHASGGLHSLTLLRIVEIVLVVRRDVESGRLSWDEFLHVGAEANALGAVYPALRIAEKLAPGTIPPRILEISAQVAPHRVRTIVDTLEPATAHRVERASISEHFMWVTGFSGWVRQIASDLAPGSDFLPIYQARAYRLLRGRVTR